MEEPLGQPVCRVFQIPPAEVPDHRGNISCPSINEAQAKLYLNSRLAGARAGGKQVVNTGWPPADTATATQVPNDRYRDNDQPAPKAAANSPAPSVQVRDIAGKEVSQALASCNNDRAMRSAYGCACLQVKIYDYRIKHPAETSAGTPTLASLFNGKELQPETCLTDATARRLAHEAGPAAGLRTAAAQDCAADKFVAAIHASPVPGHAQAQLDAAYKACKP